MSKKYVWLNLETGEFSNSWDEKIHERITHIEEDLKEVKSPWKLIEYTCLSDKNFEFCNLMKLK